MNKKTVLFVVQNMAAFLELLALAKILKRSGRYEAVFYLHRNKGNARKLFIAKCQEAGIRYKLGRQARWYLQGVGKPPKKPKTFKSPLLAYFNNVYWKIWNEVFLTVANVVLTKRLLKKESPSAIVLDSGVQGSNLSLHGNLIKIGNKKDIPTILYTWALLLKWNRIARIVGDVKYVLVSCQFQKDIIVSRKIDHKKIFVTGVVSEDPIYHVTENLIQQRTELLGSLNGAVNKKIILYAVPQHGEEKALTWQEHFKLLERLIQFMSASSSVQLLLSFHPRVKMERYQYLAEKFPIKILTKRCVEVIPLADLFVACVSSMVRTALMCQVPCLVQNIVLDLHDYKVEHGIIEVKSEKDFKKYFERIINDQEFYQSLKETLKPNKEYFGSADGKAGARALAFLDKNLT